VVDGHKDRRLTRLETDVIVVGAGPAGMAAVASARESGAEIIAVEAQDRIGGNCIWSTGYVVFVDTPMQRAAGVEDSVELFLEDARRAAELQAARYGTIYDETLARIYAHESAETYRDLTERGVEFPKFIHRPKQHRVDRVAAVADTMMFAAAFETDFAADNVRPLFGTHVERLIAEEGRVVGATASSVDGSQRYELSAREGVILAAGGFQANPAIRERYQLQSKARQPYLGIDTARGDGHLLGQSVGGDLINMTLIPSLVSVASSMLEDSIAINRTGRRFHDETGVYTDRVDAVLTERDQWAYYILDSVSATRKEKYLEQMPEPRISADTLEELAEKLGVPGGELVETVSEWNAFMESGTERDPAFGRVSFAADRRGLREPPFVASRMVVGCSFACGGFTVTTSLQVVNVFGEPIGGLFAAGDCVGGFNPCADLGGIHIGGAMTFGRLAGRAAAGATPLVEPHTVSPFRQHLPSRVGARVELVDVE
jgi:succinate dehydrogenase/fumarate reductase flavoprotein subunit